MNRRSQPVNQTPWLSVFFALGFAVLPYKSVANVSHGSPEGATNYFQRVSRTLGFSTPSNIFETTLDEVANYLGYAGLTGADLQNTDPSDLMSPEKLFIPGVLSNPTKLDLSLGVIPIRPDDILATRFFAPKIMDIKKPESERPTGWRKLVRIRAREGSQAREHKISSVIILFNFFSAPGATPFTPNDESINTQVMLVTELSSVGKRGTPESGDLEALYWLDYDRLSKGGRLSLALHASFDSNELPPSSDGSRDYFVPDGCIACHGINSHRPMINYLDTDHWFDRLSNDFPGLKAQGLPLLFDAKTNDPNSMSYRIAMDAIRRLNMEADEQAANAQPKHDEVLAAKKWIELHKVDSSHIPPIRRAIGKTPQWNPQSTNDVLVLESLNQFCYRCHGSVKFSVFNKQSVISRKAFLKERISPEAPIGVKMPPDRPLPEEVRKLLTELIK